MNINRSRFSLILLILLFSPVLRATDVPVIAAASSVKFALQDITKAFHQDTGKNVRISYSSSGNLTRQIQQGSPFELFLSANSIYIARLYQQQKTLDQGTVYALGRMAILTTKNSPILLDKDLHKTKQALQKGQIQYFAIANPEHSPYGVAAREILQKLNLWELVQSHLVLGENAAQATQFASSGAAQIGLVSYSLALAPILQNRTRYLLLPANLHQPLQQTMVLLNNTGNTAKLFFKYLQQDKAQTILSRYGYTTP
ncbi:molybdate ABC transporter substrate-binding protein [Methylococcaceae bacterium HT4]|nr:molybdate ABC transporter substrate-binding protein [Methylococcaceae bacterium CS4]TXL04437.1 molybdate ABC transporter substrate-binding protein [Methylococcaceae bacterium CS1]TXL09811.1 molybdate ABC transporter substrate-binding protein [Methylococcaceae bacterium CS2]TXL13435.1 molybdate ABC transporter substrate-binding protein [Methylococcaceae bacterium HT4]TXL19621.1 molybdate ABC transporter substrate-binding protein [Methylococcaceae bacterium HT5]